MTCQSLPTGHGKRIIVNTKNDELNAYLNELEVDVAGVADLDLYGDKLLGVDPDVAGQYRYGVTYGLRLTRGIMETVKDGPNSLYLHHYRQLNYRLDMIGYVLSKWIEGRGHRSLPFAASQVVDWQNQKGHISHKKVGEVAGVGWIGRNNLLVHPRFGAYVRYNTVLTSMPLAPGIPLARDCGNCRVCVGRCPAEAIKEDRAMFDHRGCFEQLNRFRKERNIGHHICGICVEACRGEE
jgi:epoxyqueuosine reductase